MCKPERRGLIFIYKYVYIFKYIYVLVNWNILERGWNSKRQRDVHEFNLLK